MGGMGFIHTAECEIMHNSALINIHMIDAATQLGVRKYFFSSSACVYPDMKPGEPEMIEAEAYPALPDNEYGLVQTYVFIWEISNRHSTNSVVVNYPSQHRHLKFLPSSVEVVSVYVLDIRQHSLSRAGHW